MSEAVLLPSGRTKHTRVVPDVCYFELFLKYLLPLMNLIAKTHSLRTFITACNLPVSDNFLYS